MAKVSYANLKLKVNTNIKKIEGTEIEVLQYLPIEEKYSFINIVLQQSKVDGIYNPMLLDMFFHLYLVYMYTNLTFTDKQREDELKLYDTLQSSGFISKMLEKISDVEYNTLYTYLEETADYLTEYKNTLKYFAKNLLSDMTGKIDNLQNMINEIDEEKYTQVIDFAKALNGGREI